MKKSLLFLFLFSFFLVSAQVKIGESPNVLDPSSILELESTTRALVITRLTTDEMEALNPLEGAIVYNEDEACIFYYDGTVWNNLCDSEGESSLRAAVWGEITGTIADQVDLAGEFAKYVDLTSIQAIAGEKTFTEKLTVNTGNVGDQAAEFLGRVKGEEGTAPEDFVTKAQLDASGGSAAWGALTGTLTDQTDLATEFANYVNLTTAQTIAGAKIFSDKLVVNTGDITAQSAEFLGRVKGEQGTAPEDFVTKAQLDASGGGGAAWGGLTGTLTDQTDLANEFANYVDLTTAQTVAGAKTFSDKLIVDTGDLTAQSAEFLGRVKGEDGSDPQDYVTKSQLDAVITGGHQGITGSVFFAGTNNDPIENNTNLFWDDTNNRLGIGTNTPNSALHINGPITAPINFAGGGFTLDESSHTLFLNGDTFVTIPNPQLPEMEGRIYFIKKKPSDVVTISFGYLDADSNFTTTMTDNVVQLQSNGFQWEQIN